MRGILSSTSISNSLVEKYSHETVQNNFQQRSAARVNFRMLLTLTIVFRGGINSFVLHGFF